MEEAVPRNERGVELHEAALVSAQVLGFVLVSRSKAVALEMGCEILVNPVSKDAVVPQVAGAFRQTVLALFREPLVDQAFDRLEQRLDAGFRRGLPQSEKPLRGVRLLVFFRDRHHRQIDLRERLVSSCVRLGRETPPHTRQEEPAKGADR